MRKGHPSYLAVALLNARVVASHVIETFFSAIHTRVPDFAAIHGLRAALIAPTKIIQGLGMGVGMDIVHVEGATGDYFTDLSAKAAAAVATLTARDAPDALFLHVKAVDDAAHDRNVPLRVRALACVDRMLGQAARGLWAAQAGGRRFGLAVIGDHSTPVLFGDHSHEPVPIALARLEDVVRTGRRRPGEDESFNGCRPHPHPHTLSYIT